LILQEELLDQLMELVLTAILSA